jgi:putative hydrolase of the HAD superfamily
MKKINAVIFDWGGVLIDDPAPALFKYCSKVFGVSIEQYIIAFEICMSDFQIGAITEQQFWANIAKRLNVPPPETNSLWIEAFTLAYKPRQEMFSLATSLRKAGCKTAILSNTEIPTVELIRKQKFAVFDVEVFSCIEGMAKPGREIYDLTVNRLGVSAKQTIFIDDKPENIDGAKLAGLNTIFFETMEKFKKDMAGFFPNLL